ncbi:hypothetical protein [uncultured Jannaschia sp.]|uniref:hypothetical protein n=1 Tax=uncultured Jannaschia sp. TaxID=293347 RepID=UPI00260829FA|nr:hypothetical protein [uncultured Jannaschia sp.]
MRNPGLLLGIFLVILILPLLVDRVIERSSLIRVSATTAIVSFTLRPDRPGDAVQIPLADVETCNGPTCRRQDGLLQIGTATAFVLQSLDGGRFVLRLQMLGDQTEGCLNRWVPQSTGNGFDSFAQPSDTGAQCNPGAVTFVVGPVGAAQARWLALRVDDLVIGQALGPSSHPRTAGLFAGNVSLLSPSFRSDVMAWLSGGSGELRDYRPTSEQELSAGDAARLGRSTGTSQVYLTLSLPQDGIISASAVALSNELEIITYGLPGQIVQSSWFDRLAEDDLLGMWITILIIVSTLWLEALFLSGRSHGETGDKDAPEQEQDP